MHFQQGTMLHYVKQEQPCLISNWVQKHDFAIGAHFAPKSCSKGTNGQIGHYSGNKTRDQERWLASEVSAKYDDN